MMTIQELIDRYSNDDGFQWGIDTAMASIRPGCLYSLTASGGQFEILDWPDNQWSDVTQSYVNAPTPQEIRDEYIRQQTIAECLEYFKQKEKQK